MGKFIKVFGNLFVKYFCGFLSPFVTLTRQQEIYIKYLINNPNEKIIKEFEQRVAQELGTGKAVTFASGRMAFYSILKTLNLKPDDEVLLTGFTCAVMANAVLKIGAKIKYVDIDVDTLGTSYDDLKRKVSPKTKVIVAQHSFGIPCDIEKISNFAKENNIYLIEDCALTFGSKYNGITCGNWGDVAIFSTDHTKPLNSLIGGFAYTKDESIFKAVSDIQKSSATLSLKHQNLVINKYIKEAQQERISYKLFYIDCLINAIKQKFLKFKSQSPYLLEDSTSDTQNCNYPYPSRMPASIAYLATLSLQKYKGSIPQRTYCYREYLSIIGNYEYIPKSLMDNKRQVIPLRLPFILTNKSRDEFNMIDDWIWFKRPIIATEEKLENFFYNKGDCPVAEYVGSSIMNLPIILDSCKSKKLLKMVMKIYNN